MKKIAKDPIVLSIGYTDILLPDDMGIQTILRALRRGMLCRERLYHQRITIAREPAVRIEITTVPAGTVIEYEEPSVDVAQRPLVVDRPRLVGT